MADTIPLRPRCLKPEFGGPELDQAGTFAGMRAAMRFLQEVTARSYGHAEQAVHVESHGLLQGTVEVPHDLMAIGDDRTSFNPWHGIAAHRPLGGIMRSRREAYPELSGMRSRIDGSPLHEPSGEVSLPA
ncbi:hypothetical protein [Rhizosaccharibacter radicis]|uniref:Uncharacterized protein n=1 Tax=Rhizosaccharibacter radicis TaxID=2782605 RepID=A0ABT1VUR6_9PROT|nr:hypothetical protein [Acetobacteraceae bacterium KSS12]